MGRKAFKVPIVGINIYLLKDELERLNSVVGQHQRSKFIREAVNEKLDRLEKKDRET